MSSLNSSQSTPLTSISLDTVLSQEAYITSLDDFLAEKNPSKALVYWLLEHENPNYIHDTDDIRLSIERSICSIDHLINDQLNEIIHHPRFQKLEAAWRGLWYLVFQADGIKNIKIKMLDISWADVTRDIQRALEFDQSQLFQKVYSDEYGIPGGEPYGVLIGDYEISHKPSAKQRTDDINTLKGLAEIAAAAFAPFIAGASSELFGIDDFSTLGTPLNLSRIFDQNEYIAWRGLRDMSDSRFIGLTLPKILLRTPYRTTPGSYKGLFFYEKNQQGQRDSYLWGNAAFGFGAILIREFGSVGWFGHIRGVPRNQIGGGLLTNLPVDCFNTDAGEIAHKPVTDVVITDTMERELSSLGFTPLCQCYDIPFAAFYSNQSVQKPAHQGNNSGNRSSVNAKLSSMLQHVLCASRVAHYLKVMIRDKVGSFASADDCEKMLRDWLFRYTSGRDDMEWEEQARFPLKEGQVEVKENPSNPGQYHCTIRLVPHYQIDQMTSELELITELLKSK